MRAQCSDRSKPTSSTPSSLHTNLTKTKALLPFQDNLGSLHTHSKRRAIRKRPRNARPNARINNPQRPYPLNSKLTIDARLANGRVYRPHPTRRHSVVAKRLVHDALLDRPRRIRQHDLIGDPRPIVSTQEKLNTFTESLQVFCAVLAEVVEVDGGRDAGIAGSQFHRPRGVVLLHLDDRPGIHVALERDVGVTGKKPEGTAPGGTEVEEVRVFVPRLGAARCEVETADGGVWPGAVGLLHDHAGIEFVEAEGAGGCVVQPRLRCSDHD